MTIFAPLLSATLFTLVLFNAAFSAISISVDAEMGKKAISPYIYGRNINGINDTDSNITDAERDSIFKMNEAGIRFIRANNGNNATRYNWRKKLTVHPDWYNNVNAHDWDITAKKIQELMPQANAMYAFQLTGYAASTNAYNFADWDFYVNHSNTWANTSLDLAGGGVVMDDGETLVSAGDYSLYNEIWTEDSTVGIIDHWMRDLKYDMSRFTYWSMDNEMDIWANTHNDLPLNITADFLIERYIKVAKKAKETWQNIKLTGPVAANEWFFCSIAYSDGTSSRIKSNATGESRDYCYLEYFIKKIAEAEQKSNMRLIDVIDLHWYPSETNYEDEVNWHRVFFDTNYVYKGANGIKQVNGIWDNSINKEFIFKRINDWLNTYFGINHGITLAITETGLGIAKDAMTVALIYASWLGTFMDNGVEIFTPWTWNEGMYEVVHLFSRYGHTSRVESVSTNDSLVSAYASVNETKDSLTIILVNRAEKDSQTVDVNISNFNVNNGKIQQLTLSNLSKETFVSHESNALQKEFVTITDNKVSLVLKNKSITALLLTLKGSSNILKQKLSIESIYFKDNSWYLNNENESFKTLYILNCLGKQVYHTNDIQKGHVRLDLKNLNPGKYIVRLQGKNGILNNVIVHR